MGVRRAHQIRQLPFGYPNHHLHVWIREISSSSRKMVAESAQYLIDRGVSLSVVNARFNGCGFSPERSAHHLTPDIAILIAVCAFCKEFRSIILVRAYGAIAQ